MSDQPTSTDINALLDDLDAGVFREKLARALSDAAAGVVATGKAGDVTVKFSLKQIADSSQVDCAHRLSYTVPTAKGKRSEENTTKTPLYVGRGGKLTLFPENQHKFEFDAQAQDSTQRA
ncbi:hypothetical protein MKP05_09565 [Halomonas sp. EGI 63088]|uniref:Uncharacterized protein n=1 Tax=Halomonas flagellata TaxID=2920385 RepID=A0ABS9RU41_9GAMM|nr:hypothetical protein [Halomonas flagellata]MCH4563376.1 hypothetical protein [Halomonas flagellata]